MLKGFPRVMSRHSGVIYPMPEADREVGRYAIQNNYIVAETRPFFSSVASSRSMPETTPFFVIDMRDATCHKFKSRPEFEAFLVGSGIDIKELDWED